MDYKNCIIEFELNTGKKGLVIASDKNKSTSLFVDGKHKLMDAHNAREVYRAAKKLWLLVGVVPVSHTTTPYGPGLPTWGNIATFPGVACVLKEVKWRAWRWEPDMDDGSFTEWVIELSQPVESLARLYNEQGYLSEEFVDLVTGYLVEHYDFRYDSEDVQSGEQYVSWNIEIDDEDGTIVRASNHVQKDV